MSVLLPSRLQTADQLSELVIELREYIGKLHDRAVRVKVTNVHDEAIPPLSPLAKQLFEANHVAVTAVPDMRQLLVQLEEARITAPHMRIMLPAWPNIEIRERITAQVRSSIHPHMVLTFTVRADMGGGCILQAGSHRYDFSFHTQLLAGKHKVSELLKTYATA